MSNETRQSISIFVPLSIVTLFTGVAVTLFAIFLFLGTLSLESTHEDDHVLQLLITRRLFVMMEMLSDFQQAFLDRSTINTKVLESWAPFSPPHTMDTALQSLLLTQAQQRRFASPATLWLSGALLLYAQTEGGGSAPRQPIRELHCAVQLASNASSTPPFWWSQTEAAAPDGFVAAFATFNESRWPPEVGPYSPSSGALSSVLKLVVASLPTGTTGDVAVTMTGTGAVLGDDSSRYALASSPTMMRLGTSGVAITWMEMFSTSAWLDDVAVGATAPPADQQLLLLLLSLAADGIATVIASSPPVISSLAQELLPQITTWSTEKHLQNISMVLSLSGLGRCAVSIVAASQLNFLIDGVATPAVLLGVVPLKGQQVADMRLPCVLLLCLAVVLGAACTELTLYFFFVVPVRRFTAAQAKAVSEFDFRPGALQAAATAASSGRLSAAPFEELRAITGGFMEMGATLETFSSYIPKEVAKDMLATGSFAVLSMAQKPVTVLFVSINSFPLLVDRLPPGDLVHLMEQHFDVTTRTLLMHGCTIDKYIGDTVMGFWGAPLPYPLQGYSACCASLHLQSAIQRVGSQCDAPLPHPPAGTWAEGEGEALTVRIGVAHGVAAVGNLGCSERMSYTVLGDTVNVASRLESLNRHQHSAIVVADTVLGDLEATGFDAVFGTRRLGLIRVKGKQNAVGAFELVGVGKGEASKMKAKAKAKAAAAAVGDGPAAAAVLRAGSSHSLGAASGSTTGSQPPPLLAPSPAAATRPHNHRLSNDSYYSHVSHNSYNSARHHDGSAAAAEEAALEKVAALSVEEELKVIRSAYCLDDDGVSLLLLLTAATHAFEAMEFGRASAMVQEALALRKPAVEQCRLHVPSLKRLQERWLQLALKPPSKDQFDPCINMTVK